MDVVTIGHAPIVGDQASVMQWLIISYQDHFPYFPTIGHHLGPPLRDTCDTRRHLRTVHDTVFIRPVYILTIWRQTSRMHDHHMLTTDDVRLEKCTLLLENNVDLLISCAFRNTFPLLSAQVSVVSHGDVTSGHSWNHGRPTTISNFH